jgi:tetratricopeptide (TPR) repeat protein
LDDRQVGPDGASLRCSVCAYVFRIEPGARDEPTWRIETVDDMQFFAPDLTTLRLWITEGRLHPDDRVSRTGKHWLRLGDMPEFSSAFAGFKGLPQVFSVSDSPAIEQLGPPPSFAGSEPDDMAGVPQITSPPPPTGVIAIDPEKPAHGVNKSYVGKLPAAPAPPPTASVGELQTRSAPIDIAGEAYAGPEVGAPSAVVEERSSRPNPKAGPTSMLQAVTSIVQPITRSTTDPATAAPSSPATSSPAASAARPTSRADSPSSSALHKRSFAADVSQSSARMRRPRRSSWPLIAALGGLAGVAVVFGIPSIRARVFGVAAEIVGESTPEPAAPELAAARAALTTLDGDAMVAADTNLAKLGPDDAAAVAMRAEIAAAAVLSDTVAAIVAGEAPPPTGATDPYTTVGEPRAAALVALARGVAATHAGADAETALLAQAAGLWRTADAPVPAGVISGLESISPRSGLGTLVLALAYLRGGDRTRTRQLADEILAKAPEQRAALALRAAAAPDGSDETAVAGDGGGTGTAGADAGSSDDGLVLEGDTDATVETGEAGDTGTDDASDGGGGADPTARIPIDTLISRGCDKVEAGDASGGVKLLERARIRRPQDVDVLSCLGAGYAKLGSYATSLKFFKQALDRSPKFSAALRGAGRASAKLGQEADAVRYYRRLLAVAPGDEAAQSYIAAHGGTGPGAGGGADDDDDGGTTPPPPSEPDSP